MQMQEGDTRMQAAERGEDEAYLFARGEEDKDFVVQVRFEESPEKRELFVERGDGVVLL